MITIRTIRTLVLVGLLLVAATGTAVACTEAEFEERLASDGEGADTVDCERAAYDDWVSTHGYEATFGMDGRVVFFPDPAGFASYLNAVEDCRASSA